MTPDRPTTKENRITRRPATIAEILGGRVVLPKDLDASSGAEDRLTALAQSRLEITKTVTPGLGSRITVIAPPINAEGLLDLLHAADPYRDFGRNANDTLSTWQGSRSRPMAILYPREEPQLLGTPELDAVKSHYPWLTAFVRNGLEGRSGDTIRPAIQLTRLEEEEGYSWDNSPATLELPSGTTIPPSEPIPAFGPLLVAAFTPTIPDDWQKLGIEDTEDVLQLAVAKAGDLRKGPLLPNLVHFAETGNLPVAA